MKIVINKCYGGFGLSNKAIKEYLKRKGKEAFFYKQVEYEHNTGRNRYVKVNEDDENIFTYTLTKDLGEETSDVNYDEHFFSDRDIERTDSDLVDVVKELGEEANNQFSNLKVVEIPDGLDYYIDEYHGIESIHENHKSWG